MENVKLIKIVAYEEDLKALKKVLNDVSDYYDVLIKNESEMKNLKRVLVLEEKLNEAFNEF